MKPKEDLQQEIEVKNEDKPFSGWKNHGNLTETTKKLFSDYYYT